MVRKKKTIEDIGKGVILRVKVKTNSNRFEIKKINRWTGLLEIAVSKPAKKGKANLELIKRLEERFNKKVRIKTGRKSDEKTLVIYNISKKEVKDILSNVL